MRDVDRMERSVRDAEEVLAAGAEDDAAMAVVWSWVGSSAIPGATSTSAPASPTSSTSGSIGGRHRPLARSRCLSAAAL